MEKKGLWTPGKRGTDRGIRIKTFNTTPIKKIHFKRETV